MLNISKYFHKDKQAVSKRWSFVSHLEGSICRYALYNAGDPDALFYKVCYYPELDIEYDDFPDSTDYLIGYITSDGEYAFILESCADIFWKHIAAYNPTVIPVESLDKECLCIDTEEYIPELFSVIKWIDDDFLNDESIEFDYDAFYLIDDDIRYLNPKHFSPTAMFQYLKYHYDHI